MEPTKLERRRLSTASLVFIIIAASAPLTVLAGGIPTNFAVAGLLGVPQTYIVLGLLLVLFAVGYTAMSREIQNAGAFYAYVTEGLGNRQGIAAAILALVSYNMMQIGLYGLFGFASANLIAEFTGVALPWWLTAALGWLVVALLGVRSVDVSAKVLGVVVVLEFVVVLVVDVMALGIAPEGVSSAALQSSEFFVPGIGVLLAFGIAAFMGFESGAIYSEEVIDPRRTVSRATYIALTLIALFYAFSAWAVSVGVGPSSVVEESQTYGPDLIFQWLGQQSPMLANFANVLFVTSLLAVLLAFHNATARYFFALGRSTVLPAFLGRTAANGAPRNGSMLQSGLAIVVVAGFAIAGINHELGDLFPVITLFTWLTNAAAFGLVFLLAITSVAIIMWFKRNPNGRGIWTRIIAPGLATVGLTAVFVMILANFGLMIEAEEGSALIYIMPGIILAGGIIGLIWGQIIQSRRPADFEQMRDQDQLTDDEELAIARGDVDEGTSV
ncbi:MAG: APC family permease [Yaniella sp.]|uniref:APC family permease n=2 Tax=Yaniella sp. TaxID=2773929 RepID=UPI002648A2DF|nr:APC family permease [Yaniella sp.]MDN5742075.1 APC family permease [Yaniella sp.]MDN5888903.1 APC family permease [Yaniella sp.]MDN6455777.1 APC family permease [Yaniella sp.]MDN6637914.1 APC family permease [Yaniella sp.]